MTFDEFNLLCDGENDIADAVRGGIPAILKQANMTQRGFAEKYGIPLRSVEGWCARSEKNARTAPPYVVKLIAYAVFNK